MEGGADATVGFQPAALDACMKPDRILCGGIAGGETFDFLDVVLEPGHGSILYMRRRLVLRFRVPALMVPQSDTGKRSPTRRDPRLLT